jgi:hypothetical protein
LDNPSTEQSSPNDEILAELERRIENDSSSVDSMRLASPPIDAALVEEHKKRFELIDNLAMPIRTALDRSETPPQIPDYFELKEIGRGGMGVVYRAEHLRTLRTDAIKVIRPDRLASVDSERAVHLRNRFKREWELAGRVSHEHIVPVYQVGEIESGMWFSMLYVDGPTLYECTRGQSWTPEKIARTMECIARAVAAVHRRDILHGDIKPHNILIERETDRPLISDFGLAEFVSLHSDGQYLGIAGTPAYMAPEIANAALSGVGSEEAAAIRSVSSDIYSLGATLWSALAGRSPCHEGRTLQQQMEDVVSRNMLFADKQNGCIPVGLDRICQKCLEQNPTERYRSALELADDLAGWLSRPSWNRHFPGLRQLLVLVVAPVLAASGILVTFLLTAKEVNEAWIGLAMLWGYGPLFATFWASQRSSRTNSPARRELWSIWIGHFCASIACLTACRIFSQGDTRLTVAVFYPSWAAISSVTFFAKSGNFWITYRWFGVVWSIAAVVMTIDPILSPTIFGVLAAISAVATARGDREFGEP